MKIENSFGDVLKQLRCDRNLKLREASELLGIDTSTLGKLEKNSRKPNPTLLKKISKIFNIDLKELNVILQSDLIANDALKFDGNPAEILKVAERKVEYLKNLKQLTK